MVGIIFILYFSSETKMMVVKCAPKFPDAKLKEEVFVKGAIEKVLPLCTQYIDSSGNYAAMTKEKQNDFIAEAYNIARMGKFPSEHTFVDI